MKKNDQYAKIRSAKWDEAVRRLARASRLKKDEKSLSQLEGHDLRGLCSEERPEGWIDPESQQPGTPN